MCEKIKRDILAVAFLVEAGVCWVLVRRVETPLLVLCDTSLSASLKLKLDMSNGVKLTKKKQNS